MTPEGARQLPAVVAGLGQVVCWAVHFHHHFTITTQPAVEHAAHHHSPPNWQGPLAAPPPHAPTGAAQEPRCLGLSQDSNKHVHGAVFAKKSIVNENGLSHQRKAGYRYGRMA
jgi:hypothetical protein